MAGISVSKLKTFNAGVKGSTLGASGPQYVMVPKKHADQLRESLASGEIAAVQSTLVADNTPLNSRVYTVRSGDTLSSIASRLGVSTKDLQQWNKLRGSKLKPCQSLTIGAGSSAQRLANNSDSITYRVRKGDSLSSIAKRHGVNIKDVMRWNSDTANLQPCDKLTLFVKTTTCQIPDKPDNERHRFPVPFYLCCFMCFYHDDITGERAIILQGKIRFHLCRCALLVNANSVY